MDRRPRGRDKNVTGQGNDIRKGSAVGGGPVGRSGGYAGRRPEGSGQPQGNPTPTRSGGRGISPIAIIIIIAALIFGGSGLGLSSLFGSSGSTANTGVFSPFNNSGTTETQNAVSGWATKSNVGELDTSVASGARAKRTQLIGKGEDKVTVMVYLCGTDLESKNGMASSDLAEMAAAKLSDNVNVLVYTGGCKQWKTKAISNTSNQIYQLVNGGIKCLVKDDGSDSMTKPATLTRFIKYCSDNFPANRNILVMWDHGGGAISGFGYDERNTSSGSMNLKGISDALRDGGVTFDFVGFDACLMGTLENALMLDKYADYLIASEETEPGMGWYHTTWINELSKNSSIPTIQLGKVIADDFVSYCNQKCPGQKTTLSVIDLAELSATVPETFSTFAKETASVIKSNNYKKVSDARAMTREFATSSKSDQVDAVHLALNMGTDEGAALAESILGAVKYNRVSSNMTNSYGMAIYFPYQRTSRVDSAVRVYEDIGIDENYTQCVRSFASLEVAGQAVSGGNQSALGSLLGSFTGQSPSSSASVGDLLGSLLGGNSSLLSGLTDGASSFFGKGIEMNDTVEYLTDNQFDQSKLVWLSSGGKTVMTLPDEQWALVHDLQLNLFYDDGEGYIDMGLDNVYDFTEDGDLIGEFDGTWLAIDSNPVAYYYLDTTEDTTSRTITGRIPVLLNGVRANLIIVFDKTNPNGYIAGARYDYVEGETDTIAKGLTELTVGDKIQPLCDYYSYSGEYQQSYTLGDEFIYSANHTISNVYVDEEKCSAVYMFTDIYNQEYWTPVIP